MGEHIVLGIGPLGKAVTDELVLQGKSVTVVSRSRPSTLQKDVQFKQCDFLDREKTIETLRNAAVLYYCVGLPYAEWQENLPKIMHNVIAAAEHHQAKIVYADNVYAYGKQIGPLHEELSYRPLGAKTTVRAEVAHLLMQASSEGRIKATIGRSSDFYGPGVQQATLGSRVFQHLLENRPVELIGNPNKRHSHMYIKDFARGLILLGEAERANDEVWHIPHLPAMSTKQIVEEVAAILSKTPTYRIANKTIVFMMSLFNEGMKEYKELLYQTTNDFIVDSTKFEQHFEFTCTPLEEALQETLDWYREEKKRKKINLKEVGR